MKKIFSLFSLLLIGLLLVGCGDKNENTNKELPTVELSSEVSIITPSGTPYLAIGGLLANDKIKIDLSNGAEGLKPALLNGSYDIVIAPVNLGTQLFNAGNSKFQMSHIITTNNAYIVTKSENKLDNIGDLAGQSVLAFGKSASLGIPGSVLKEVYEKNELDISNIKYEYSSSAEVYSAFLSNATGAKYALMSEPEISKLVLKDKLDVKTLDLAQVLGSTFAQACVYVNPESTNVEDINKVLNLIDEMVKYLNENPETYADTVLQLDESRKFDAMGKDVIVRSIPLTNIVFKEAKTNKTDIETILNILGVKLPNDAFYR